MTMWQIALFGIAVVLFIAYDILVNRRSDRLGKSLEDDTRQWDKAKNALK